jgi:uncharacterized protein (DUF1330 family)
VTAYLIGDIEVLDPVAYEQYRQRVPALIEAHGGRYLVRGAHAEVLEGDWTPKRSVVLAFPDMQALRGFWDSAEYRPLRAIRERAAKSNLVAFEGV